MRPNFNIFVKKNSRVFLSITMLSQAQEIVFQPHRLLTLLETDKCSVRVAQLHRSETNPVRHDCLKVSATSLGSFSPIGHPSLPKFRHQHCPFKLTVRKLQSLHNYMWSVTFQYVLQKVTLQHHTQILITRFWSYTTNSNLHAKKKGNTTQKQALKPRPEDGHARHAPASSLPRYDDCRCSSSWRLITWFSSRLLRIYGTASTQRIELGNEISCHVRAKTKKGVSQCTHSHMMRIFRSYFQ